MSSCNFLRLIFNKVTPRSYGYFFKASYSFLKKKLIFPTMSKTAEFGKKTQGILGVNSFE
jgi:hypothetical protein